MRPFIPILFLLFLLHPPAYSAGLDDFVTGGTTTTGTTPSTGTTTDTSTNNPIVNTGDIFVDFDIILIGKYAYTLSSNPTTSANGISSTSYYDWNWSSTGNSRLAEPTRYSTFINILSDQSAQYDITLTVTRKSDGATGCRTKRIQVKTDGSFSIVNGNLSCNDNPPPQFRITSISGVTTANIGDTKTYRAIPSGNQGTVSYQWALNQDVLSATGDSVNVTFNNAGTNTISVVGTDSIGTQANAQTNVNVTQASVSSDFTATTNGNFVSLSYSNFTLTPTLEENTPVTFTASTFNSNYNYQWQAQNTTTNSKITTFSNNSFDYVFPEGAGTYKITLKISGNDIAASTTEKYIAIKQASQATQPEVKYAINNTLSVCNAPVYTFTATAPNQINSVNWSTSNLAVIEEVGNSSTTSNPINYKFTKAGTYTIAANIVTTASSVNESQEITIDEDALDINCPDANFTISQPVQACRAVTYDVDASTATTSDENDPLVGYQWSVLDTNDDPVLSSNFIVKNQSQRKATLDIKAVGNYKIGLTVTTQNGYSNTTTQSIALIATLPEVGCPQQVEFEASVLPDGQTFIFTISPANQTYTWFVNAKERNFTKLSEGRYRYTIGTQDKPFYSPYDEIFYYEVSPQASDATLEPAKPKNLVLKQQNAVTLAIPRLMAQMVDRDLLLSILNREEYPSIQVDIKQGNKNLANEEIESGKYKFANIDIAEGDATIQLSVDGIQIPLTKQNGIITVKPYVSIITPTLDGNSVEAPYSIYVDGSNSYMPMQNDNIDSYQWWLLSMPDCPTPFVPSMHAEIYPECVEIPTCDTANIAQQTTGLQGDLTQARTHLTLTAQGSYKVCLTVTTRNGVTNSNGTDVINVASYTQHQVDIQRYTGNLATGNLIPYNQATDTIIFYGDVFVANQAKQIDANDIVNLSTEDNAVSVFMNIEISDFLLNSTATVYNILQVMPPNWDDDLGIWYMQTPETYPFYAEWSLFDENGNVSFAALEPSIPQMQLKQNNTIMLYNGDFEDMAGDYNFFVILEQDKSDGTKDYYFSYPPLQLKVTTP